MKRFHLSGTVTFSWSAVVDAETQGEAEQEAESNVSNYLDKTWSFDIDTSDEEEQVFEE